MKRNPPMNSVFTTVQLFTARVIDLGDAFISGINFFLTKQFAFTL